mgnify:CR=1 FL=1
MAIPLKNLEERLAKVSITEQEEASKAETANVGRNVTREKGSEKVVTEERGEKKGAEKDVAKSAPEKGEERLKEKVAPIFDKSACERLTEMMRRLGASTHVTRRQQQAIDSATFSARHGVVFIGHTGAGKYVQLRSFGVKFYDALSDSCLANIYKSISIQILSAQQDYGMRSSPHCTLDR